MDLQSSGFSSVKKRRGQPADWKKEVTRFVQSFQKGELSNHYCKTSRVMYGQTVDACVAETFIFFADTVWGVPPKARKLSFPVVVRVIEAAMGKTSSKKPP